MPRCPVLRLRGQSLFDQSRILDRETPLASRLLFVVADLTHGARYGSRTTNDHPKMECSSSLSDGFLRSA